MDKMGIPSTLIKWIKVLYSNPYCSIILNNFIGAPLKVERGIRQGCPLSPLLYSICAEGLASLVRNNCNLRGIFTPHGESSVRLIQHADDTNLFISNNSEFDVIQNILNIYCKGSGSKLNIDKSKGLWLGDWRNRKHNPCHFTFVKKLRIIGIVFGNDITPEDNWGSRINKIHSTLNKWSKRHLTLNGKVVIVNSLIGAGINYLGSVVECPNFLIKR